MVKSICVESTKVVNSICLESIKTISMDINKYKFKISKNENNQ